MTEDDKNILFGDLCSRIRYGVLVDGGSEYGVCTLVGFEYYVFLVETSYQLEVGLECPKPYLRPMSSMTEEEKKMVCSMNGLSDTELNDRIEYPNMYVQNYTIETFDLFNAHHLDYRGLIEKGLALKAQKDMYEKL